MREEEAKKLEKKDLRALDDDSPRGRGRGKHKESEDVLREEKAKGHLGKPQGEMPGEEFEGADVRSRGIQHGFGKNQGKEAVDRNTRWGSRANGGHHG